MIEDNAKLLQQLKSSLTGINWNKYQTKVSTEEVNQYLDFLINTSFQGVIIPFVLSFENECDGKVRTGYYLPKVEIKDCNVMIDWKHFLISRLQKILEHMIIFENGYAAGCFLDYNCFKEHYKMIEVDLSEQKELDSDPKTIPEINFTGNLDKAEGSTMFFIIEEERETVLDFSQGTVKVFWFYSLL